MSSFRPWIVILVSLAACGPGRQAEPSLPLIYGGTQVGEGAFDGVVGLAFRRFDGTLSLECTGTLIAPQVVLTAGHCLKGEGFDGTKPDADLSALRVYTGLGTEGGGVEAGHSVVRIAAAPHVRAHPLGYADAGLVFLADPVLDVTPVSLVASLAQQLAVNTHDHATVVGYGYREDLGRGVKFQVETTLRHLNSHEAVAGGGGRDACTGDSGGPVFVTLPPELTQGAGPVQAGIVSRGLTLQCGEGVYVSLVSDHICWIASQIPHVASDHPECVAADAPEPMPSTFDEAVFTRVCEGAQGTPSAQEAARHIRLGLASASCADAARHLAGATRLTLDGLMLRDASPLTGLRSLRSLTLRGNRIRDVQALASLPALRELDLVGNDVDDFSPLAAREAEGLIVLGKTRQISTFAVTSFARYCEAGAGAAEPTRHTVRAVLARTLAETCDVANERLLSIKTLDLSDRGLTDLAPLAGLGHIEALNLAGNMITDVTPLAGYESLRGLDITRTAVTDLSSLRPLIARGLIVTGSP